MYSAVSRNKINTWLIILVFLVIIGALGFAASAIWRSPSIGFTVLVIAALYALIQYFFASRQAIAMSHGIRVDAATEPRLYRTVENLTITMGLPMPEV
jgi:heat shock protein HtpX